jgi:hypothetical protein
MIYGVANMIIWRLCLPKANRIFTPRFSPPDFPFDKIISLSEPRSESHEQRFNIAFIVDLIQRNKIRFNTENSMIECVESEQDEKLSGGGQIFLDTLKKYGSLPYSEYSPKFNEALRRMRSIILSYEQQIYYYPISIFHYFGVVLLLMGLWQLSTVIPIIFLVCLIFALFGSGLFIILFVPKLKKSMGQICIFALMGFIFTVMGISIAWHAVNELNVPWINSVIIWMSLSIFMYTIVFIVKHSGLMIRKEYIEEQQQVLEFKHFLTYTNMEQYALIKPKIFEEYLPYAIIFNIEQKWMSSFEYIYPFDYQKSYLSHGYIACSDWVNNEYK